MALPPVLSFSMSLSLYRLFFYSSYQCMYHMHVLNGLILLCSHVTTWTAVKKAHPYVTYWSRSRTHVLRSDSRFLEGFLWRMHASSESLHKNSNPIKKNVQINAFCHVILEPSPPTSTWFPKLAHCTVCDSCQLQFNCYSKAFHSFSGGLNFKWMESFTIAGI